MNSWAGSPCHKSRRRRLGSLNQWIAAIALATCSAGPANAGECGGGAWPVLAPQQEGNRLSVDLPMDANVLPMGHYLLFAMVDDIPSEGVVLRVDAALGDHDADGDVDLADYASFPECMAGPSAAPSPDPPLTAQSCLASFDAESDGDVDARDFAALQIAFIP